MTCFGLPVKKAIAMAMRAETAISCYEDAFSSSDEFMFSHRRTPVYALFAKDRAFLAGRLILDDSHRPARILLTAISVTSGSRWRRLQFPGRFCGCLLAAFQIRNSRGLHGPRCYAPARGRQWKLKAVDRAANMAIELSLQKPPRPQMISFGTRTIQQGTRALPV